MQGRNGDVRVVVADDQPVFVRGLAAKGVLIEAEPGGSTGENRWIVNGRNGRDQRHSPALF